MSSLAKAAGAGQAQSSRSSAGPPAPRQMNWRPYLNAATGQPLSHRGDYFEVYSTVKRLRYADVNNKVDEPVPLPADIVARFANSTVAFTGWETDTEQYDAAAKRWVPAKCTELYTHHYIINMFSGLLSDPQVRDHRTAIGLAHSTRQHDLRADQDAPPAGIQVPLIQSFSNANGNEHRNSFHGVSKPAAFLIHSPSTVHALFHCINTKNPRCGTSTNCSLGPAGAPLPFASAAAPDALYSGLAECPCSTRRGDFHANDHTILFDSTIDNSSGRAYSGACKPGGSLLEQNNTSCGAETYVGGLQCCEDKMNLLDADQTVPDLETLYRYKLRFYFEEYKPSLRGSKWDNAMWLFWQTEEWQTEYDIPQAAPDIPPELAVHTLSSTFNARDLVGGVSSNWKCAATPEACLVKRRNCTYVNSASDCGAGPGVGELPPSGKVRLVYAHLHQHVGLIGGSLINQDTGQLICKTKAIYGQSDRAQDEAGYAVAILPCVWDAGEDPSLPLAPVVDLDSRLLSVVEYNSSSAHYGVMAQWQMRGVWV